MARGKLNQISLRGKGMRGFGPNKNSGYFSDKGNTRLAKGPTVSSKLTVHRNSPDTAAYSAHTGQTMGLPGRKRDIMKPRSNNGKRAAIAKSVPDRTTTNPSQYNTHVSSTVGLKGAGKPFSQSKRTTTQFDNVADKIPRNQRAFNPHADTTIGLRGAKRQTTHGTASRSNLSRDAGDKNSINPYKTPVHANEIQALKKASKKAPMLSKATSGTRGKSGGSRKIPFMGNRRQVTSSLHPQKVFNAGIPAAVRAAARRAPSNGSSKPTFTTRTVNVKSK